MSVSLWRWSEDCDSRICVGDCDLCLYDEREYDGYTDIEGTVKKTRWKITIDNGFKMYTCPECECRMTKNHYDFAVGLKGFNYCPYCGSDMRKEEENDGR